MSDAIAFLRRAIEQGQGLDRADVVLKGGRIFDLVSGDLIKSDVAICADRIVGTFGDYRGRREIDVAGKIVVPGFIDTHCHVESSLLTPLEFDRCVLARGVTTAICDPHEIANVLGQAGLRYFLDAAMLTVDGSARAALELRSGDGARDLGRAARGRRSSAVRRSSQGAGPGRVHELSRPSGARPVVPRQARRVPDPADRRPQPASAAASPSTAISRAACAPITRSPTCPRRGRSSRRACSS